MINTKEMMEESLKKLNKELEELYTNLASKRSEIRKLARDIKILEDQDTIKKECKNMEMVNNG